MIFAGGDGEVAIAAGVSAKGDVDIGGTRPDPGGKLSRDGSRNWHALLLPDGALYLMSESGLVKYTRIIRSADMPREIVHQGRKIRVAIETGVSAVGVPFRRDVILHPGAVAILPLIDEDHICLLRNERPAVGETLWEIPAGTLEPNEPIEVAAARELAEETGYTAKRLEKICVFYPSPGLLSEKTHLFVARPDARGDEPGAGRADGAADCAAGPGNGVGTQRNDSRCENDYSAVALGQAAGLAILRANGERCSGPAYGKFSREPPRKRGAISLFEKFYTTVLADRLAAKHRRGGKCHSYLQSSRTGPKVTQRHV